MLKAPLLLRLIYS